VDALNRPRRIPHVKRDGAAASETPEFQNILVSNLMDQTSDGVYFKDMDSRFVLISAALAARFGALSADHLEHTSPAGVAALAASGTVAVLLPGAFFFLCETQRPPVAALRASGVPMAVATDLNPGTSPLSSLLAAMTMACTLFALTPAEALAGTTRNAARALGLADRGALASGLRADLALWDAEHPAELTTRIGRSPLATRYLAGEPDRAAARE